MPARQHTAVTSNGTTSTSAAAADMALAAAGWRLQLLGRPRLHAPSGAVMALSPKDAALLALVALEAPLSPSRAAALLWPGAEGRKALVNLRQRVFRLRRDCGAALVRTVPALALSEAVLTDLPAALAQLAEDPAAAGEDLFGDLALDELPELAAWMANARAWWAEQRDAALAVAAARCEAAGEVVRGLAYAARLAALDPLSEHALRRLMRLHYLRGDGSAAVAAFQDFEQRLKDEVGARPGAETVELLATVERSAARLPPHRAVVPTSLLRPPRLIGREVEAAALARAWAGGRSFLLTGEAGIGKTRLLQDAFMPGATLELVRARPGDEGVAYALLARLLRQLLGRAAGSPAPDEARAAALALVLPEMGDSAWRPGAAQGLQRAAEQTLADAARDGLAAVVVDDLHFADDASVELLHALSQSNEGAALRWGFAQRAVAASGAAATWQAALQEARELEVVTLAPLPLTQLRELIDSLQLPELDSAQLAPALLRHTGGNPLFALETLKDLLLAGTSGGGGSLPQPKTVAALVQRRLEQLSAPALRLARTAALAGADFSAELAAAVLETHPLDLAGPWRELESAQVLREGAFAHDLVLEATRSTVPQPIAVLLHRRMAECLAARRAHPASVAPHWAGAEEWARAGDAYAAAARLAQAASQRSHEVELWQEAARCHGRAGNQAGAFAARCDSIGALIVVQGVEQAHQVIDALLNEAGDDAQRVAALTARAMAALMAADHPRGVAAAEQARELAQGLPTPWPRVEAARLQAVGLAQAGRSGEALALIEPLRDTVEREGSAEQQGGFWSDYAYVLNTARRLRDTAAALQLAMDHCRARGDLAELATLTSNLATVQGNLGHVGEALVLAQRAWALQVELGNTDGPQGGVVQAYVGLYSGMLGRYGQALDHLAAARARFERGAQATWAAVARNHQVVLYLQLGQVARAHQALAGDGAQVATVAARTATLAARVDRSLGRPVGPGLQRVLALLDRGVDPHVRMQALLDAAEQAEPADALQGSEEVLRQAQAMEFGGVVMRASLLRAQALHRCGRSEEAGLLLRRLLPRLAECPPSDMYLPQAWWLAVQVFDACACPDEAVLALAQATHWVRQVALPEVPQAFRDSFLQHNPTNRALLAAAGRRGG